MWHEARRRERATQRLFSDHKRRAEKRREENRIDPSGLLQVHGVKSKINIDTTTHKQAANSMVVWQGDQKTTIDRFDVRATLNSLPSEERPSNRLSDDSDRRRRPTVLDENENEFMKKLLNFERYCLIMQNDLNRVPEATRLSLVEKKNEFLTEAKMRKLQNNWFGTSGETSVSCDYTNFDTRQTSSRPHGVSIGYEYGIAQTNTDGDSTRHPNVTNLASVTDLDDNDAELDLDCVDKIEPDAENINEVINRYGLSCDEFNILVDSSTRSVKEIIRKLKQVKGEVKQACKANPLSETIKQDEYYGPTLPPDMQKRVSNIKPNQLSDNDAQPQHDSPTNANPLITVRDKDSSHVQASPVSSTDPGFASQQSRETTSISIKSRFSSPKQSDNSEESSLNKSAPALNSSSSNNQNQSLLGISESKAATTKDRFIPIQINLRISNELEGKSSHSPGEKNEGSRRASTPLAYKRHCRSSRSLSRERISSTRYRSSSSSSSSRSSRSRSSSTRSSRSYSSSDKRSDSKSRRRRIRSRSPRYRRRRRSRREYRRKGRR